MRSLQNRLQEACGSIGQLDQQRLLSSPGALETNRFLYPVPCSLNRDIYADKMAADANTDDVFSKFLSEVRRSIPFLC